MGRNLRKLQAAWLNSIFATMTQQANNPLHGKTLESILNYLVDEVGWEEMGRLVRVRCFTENPSIQSSLKFLRKAPWAREKVEALYLRVVRANV